MLLVSKDAHTSDNNLLTVSSADQIPGGARDATWTAVAAQAPTSDTNLVWRSFDISGDVTAATSSINVRVAPTIVDDVIYVHDIEVLSTVSS